MSGTATIDARQSIPTVSPDMQLWSFDRSRLIIGKERLALQGVRACDLHPANMQASDYRHCQIAGEMVHCISFAAHCIATLSNIDL